MICRMCKEHVSFGKSRCRHCHEKTPLWNRAAIYKVGFGIAVIILLVIILAEVR
jgi:hypothetical protein